MKKITLLLSSIFTLSAIFISSASAKEPGYFFDVSLNHASTINNASVTAISENGDSENLANPSFKAKNSGFDSVSLKLGYRYSNIKNSNFFLSNSIFYDHISSESASNDNLIFNINDRFGAEISLGYDITNKLSSYVTLGFADVGYKVDANSLRPSFSAVLCCNAAGYEEFQNRSSSMTKGFGVRYDLSSDIKLLKETALLFEYSRQKITLSSDHPSIEGGIMNTNNRSKIELIRFGISKAI